MGNEQSQVQGLPSENGKRNKEKGLCGPNDGPFSGIEKEIENLFSMCEAKKATGPPGSTIAKSDMTPKQANRLLKKYAEEGKLKHAEIALRNHWHLIDVMDTDDDGNTALHLAAMKGHILVCRALVKAGTYLKKNKKGKSAADLAQENNHNDCYVYLHRIEPGSEEGLPTARSQATTARSNATTAKALSEDHPDTEVSGFDMYAQEIKISRAATDGHSIERNSRQQRRLSVEIEKSVAKGKPLVQPRRGFSQERAGFSRAVSAPEEHHNAFEDVGYGDEDPDETFKAIAIYNFTADSAPPFPPDRTREFSFSKGDQFVILEVRSDGYLLARRPHARRKGWIPGNYVSLDGHKPFYIVEEKPHAHHKLKHAHKHHKVDASSHSEQAVRAHMHGNGDLGVRTRSHA